MLIINTLFTDEHGEYFANVTKLIEETFERNGGKKVILLCHSMGSPMMLHLLQTKTDEWKDKHIRSLFILLNEFLGVNRL